MGCVIKQLEKRTGRISRFFLFWLQSLVEFALIFRETVLLFRSLYVVIHGMDVDSEKYFLVSSFLVFDLYIVGFSWVTGY